MSAIEPPVIHLDIPEPNTLRNRLAVVLTEADLIRSQLRVSVRLEKERQRLRELLSEAK